MTLFKLKDIFPHSEKGFKLLTTVANGFDNIDLFSDSLKKSTVTPKQSALFCAIKEISHKLYRLSGVSSSLGATGPNEKGPVIASGQQAYVDYTLANIAKIDQLDSLSEDCRVFFGFADYDYFGSDKFISGIGLPNPYTHSNEGPIFHIRLHSQLRQNRKKDMRFVPPPDHHTLDQTFEKCKNMLSYTLVFLKQNTSAPQRKEIFNRFYALKKDYEYAARHAKSAAEFNVIWSVRVFQRLGYKCHYCEFSKLLNHEHILPIVANTLSCTIRENRLFIESINEMLKNAQGCNMCFNSKKEGYLPVFMADRKDGSRFPLMCEKRGKDHFLVSTDHKGFRANVGPANDEDIKEFLLLHKDWWSPNILLLIFLYRCGVQGFISGKSSIRYSLVIGNILKRLFGEKHPPNFLCALSLPPDDILWEISKKTKAGRPSGLAPKYEPSLVYRMLFHDIDYIVKEISAINRK